MTTTLEGEEVAVVGDRDLVPDLDDATVSDDALAVSTVAAERAPEQVGDCDCLLVDQRAVPDSWQAVVADVASARPGLPIVVLVASAFERTVPAAIEAGADDYLPRSACETDPDLVAARVTALVQKSGRGAPAAVEASPEDGPGTRARGGRGPAREVRHGRDGPTEERFELITENVGEVVYIANADFSAVEYVNPAYEEIWGRPTADLYEDATAFLDGIDPRDRESVVSSFEAMRAEIRRGEADERYDFEYRVERPDGEVRWVLATGYPVERPDGPDRFVGIVEDVTERREFERTYRELFEGVSDGLVVHEPESGDILDVNARYCEVTGYDREELVGANVRIIVADDAPDDYETARERIQEARDDGPTLFEFEGERKNGERFVAEVHLSTLEIHGAERVLASVRDVTERKRRERAIRELQAATERMQHAASADEVAEIAVETAAEALSLPVTACWFHDPAAGCLEPVAATPAVHDQDLVSTLPADRYEYAVFERGEVTTYSPTDVNPDNPLETALLLPLGEHGLVAAGRPDQATYDEVTLDVARALADHTVTALDRVRRAMEVRESRSRLQAILDRIDEAIFLAPAPELNEGQPAPDFVSSGYEEIWGQPLEGLHETYDEGFFGTLHSEDYEGYRAFIERIVADCATGEPEERYSREYRIERPDGEVRWVHSDFYPTEWGDGETQVVIVSRDVTARKERQRAVESFHDATAELTTVETVADAASIAVEAAAEILEMPATAVYHYDAETTALDAVATGPELPAPGDLATITATSPAWEAFVDESTRTVDVADAPGLAVDAGSSALVIPLGGNGVLAVWQGSADVDADAAGILAATLEAAMNRVRAERQLESRRAELAAQTERADRLEAITEVTRRVDAALTTQSTRQDVHESVCAELVEVEPFESAWIAAAAVGTDQLTPRAVAGVERDRVERALESEQETSTDPHPATAAWQTGDPQVLTDLVGSGRRGDWRQLLLKRGAGSVCAVPLAHGGITYGVLVVVGASPDAFDDQVVDVLSQLGTSVGYAITAIERQRALESDDTLELEFRGSGVEVPFARLAREVGGRVRHERTIRRQDGSVSVYYTLRDADVSAVEEPAADVLPGEAEVVSQGDDEAVIERRGSTWFGSAVSAHGGVLRRGVATDGGVELVVELPRETDTRTIADRLQAEFPALDLAAQRQHSESSPTPTSVRRRLEQRLSDRQYEALETAHAMGYFAWPRESSGEEVADALDITQPTVNKHIRLGEGKVFSLLFGATSDSAE